MACLARMPDLRPSVPCAIHAHPCHALAPSPLQSSDYTQRLKAAHDTADTAAQVFSSAAVSGGVGVYWMFYTGGDFEGVSVPQGLPGSAVTAGQLLEGLRMRPGLAMSQVPPCLAG
jgi:hypothetical protein